MQFKVIEKDNELEEYRKNFARFFQGVTLPLVYLKQGKVTAIYDKNNKMVGGYCIILDQPFRIFNFIPSSAKHELINVNQIKPENSVEVNGLWLDPSIKSKTFAMRVIRRMSVDVFKAERDYVYCWFDNKNKYFHKLYASCHINTVYQGPAMSINDDKSAHNEIYFGYFTRMNSLLGWYRALGVFAVKYFKSKRGPKKDFAEQKNQEMNQKSKNPLASKATT